MSTNKNVLSDNSSLSAPLKKRKVASASALASTVESGSISDPPSVSLVGAQTISTESQCQSVQQDSSLMMTNADEELQKALEQIDYKDKVEFLEACRKFPDLVQKESDPQRFLRCVDYSAQAAAERLVAYWKERTTIFGEQVYRPILSLSQTDALNDDDVATMCSGLIAKLPDDDQGRTVLCIDRARSNKPEAVVNQSWERCVFYWLSHAAENEISQTQGIVLLRIIKNPNENQARFQKLLSLVQNVMPVKIASLHLCCLPPRGSTRTFTDKFIPTNEQYCSDNLQKKISVHLCKSEEEMLNELVRCGFKKETLPASLGGAWTYAKFDAWINQRIRVDIRSSTVVASKKPSIAATTSKSVTLKSLVAVADRARVQDRRDRKRKMDAVYARKRRERERGEEQQLQNRCLDLNERNMRLQGQNKLLEQLLEQAKAEALKHEQETGTVSAASMSALPNNSAQRLLAFVQQQLPLMPPPAQPSVLMQQQSSLNAVALQRALLQSRQEQEYQLQQVVMQQALEREQTFRQNLLELLNGGNISPQAAAQLLQSRNAALQSNPVTASVAVRPPALPNLDCLSSFDIMALLGTSAIPKQEQQASMPAHMTMQQNPFFQPQMQNDSVERALSPGLVQALLRSQNRNEQTQQQQQQQPEQKSTAQYLLDFLRSRQN